MTDTKDGMSFGDPTPNPTSITMLLKASNQ